jgi:hypothetical protein
LGEDYLLNRRNLLKGLAASGVLSLAGCQSIGNSEDPSGNPSDTEPTPTASPDQAPEIISQSAQPQDNGRTLLVGMEAEDDEGMEYAAIRYGGSQEERTDIEGRRIDMNGELTELEDTELSDKPGQVLYLARDTAGQETRVEVSPDETAPELLNFSVQPTDNAGEISLLLEGRDNVGIEEVQLLLGGDPQLQENFSGRKEQSIDRQVTVPEGARFQQNNVTASIEDWNGNSTESEAETYIRKYDVLEDTRFDIGAETFSLGQRMFANCLSGIEATPELGVEEYGSPPTTFTSTRHIDQMTGFGVNRVNLTFGTGLSKPNIRNFLESPIIDHIDVSAEYSIKNDRTWSEDVESWKNDIVEPHMDFIHENILSRDNAATYEGRPLFTVSNAAGGWLPEPQRRRIKEEWGGYESFIDDIRNLLSVDGKDPFIIGTFGGWGLADYSNEYARTLAAQMDAVRNEKIVTFHDDNRGGWSDTLQLAEDSYGGHREFAEENGLEFVPLTGPGFDDRANTCWGPNRLVPRSQSGFENLLLLAEEYATINQIDIATWNDWTEGTQIEPGSYRGNDYDTGYLEIIEEFQKN